MTEAKEIRSQTELANAVMLFSRRLCWSAGSGSGREEGGMELASHIAARPPEE